MGIIEDAYKAAMNIRFIAGNSPVWTGADLAGGQGMTTVAVKSDEHGKVLEYKVAPQVGDVVKVSPEVESYWMEWAKDILRQDAPETPKPLPNGATRHKALPAACLVPMDDRAAFIGRWEQK